ncbi:MAG: pyruvate,orthophosphate dikinase, partial [Parcubacteria group bacterium Athens1014_26]
MAKSKKFVYFFGNGKAEGIGKMKDLLGGKGAGLAEMTNSGIPVPPGFTIITEVCNYFDEHKGKLPNEFVGQLKLAVLKLEKATDKKFGDVKNPLLVSVRSGAKFSMPGMMDTILNLGLNNETLKGLIEKTNNPRFVYDAYRRFIQMFGNVVLGIEKGEFEDILSKNKEKLGVKLDTELREEDFKNIILEYKKLVKEQTGKDFPQDTFKQLEMARDAVFKSWNNPRAITYRRLNKIADNLGTAVNIQVMVFGNMGDDCATGVGFTRNPSTGENKFYGEYLTNAQGEDVVAGIRTPRPIENLKKEMPAVYQQLRIITNRLEKQTRTGKRTAQAAVKIAVDMVKEKLINKDEALMRMEPEQINQLLHPVIDPKAQLKVVATGLPASPGAAVGKIVFTADEAVKQGEKEPVILVRTETCPDDIHGMDVARGILTARGGMTSHAAVVARGMGKCCVAGCDSVKIDEKNKKIKIGN